MNPDQGDNFWKEAESQGTMPLTDNVIIGEVQPTQEIPLGASHFAMFPQTNAILALVLAIASFAGCGLLMSIPALLVAISAKKITDNSPTHPDRGIANAAHITAIVNICVSTLFIIVYSGAILYYLTGS